MTGNDVFHVLRAHKDILSKRFGVAGLACSGPSPAAKPNKSDVDVLRPNYRVVCGDNADGIACWFVDKDYSEERFFFRYAHSLGANDPYKALKTTMKAEINKEA